MWPGDRRRLIASNRVRSCGKSGAIERGRLPPLAKRGIARLRRSEKVGQAGCRALSYRKCHKGNPGGGRYSSLRDWSLSVRHKAKQGYKPDIRDFYKIFFLCQRVCAEPLGPGSEIVDTAFFARDRLPELSKGRVIERDIKAAFAFRENPERAVVVD